MYNKTIIEFGFCDIRNNQVTCLDLDYSGYHKNLIQLLSNNNKILEAGYEGFSVPDGNICKRPHCVYYNMIPNYQLYCL